VVAGEEEDGGGMKPAKCQTLEQLLAALDRAQVLQCLAYVQGRRARDEVIQRLLEARLASLMSAPATKNQAELLTIKDVARLLKVAKARAYELTRTARIPSVKIGERQVRVRRADLDQYLTGVGMAVNP
jgi:excisionase family DNA binding protein